MKRSILGGVTAIAIVLVISGCSMSKRTAGTLAGGAAGAVVGVAVGGGAAGAAIGAAGGGLIGNQLSKK
jgi:osmotically inducible lipoprotein OsmB